MHEFIYAVTERNVDGCGGDATEYVSFGCRLDGEQARSLSRRLSGAKAAAPDGSDTADIVTDALAGFAEEAGIKGRLRGSPVTGEIFF